MTPRIDCSRCFWGRRKAGRGIPGSDLAFECAHPERASVRVKPTRVIGSAGLVQLMACPKLNA